MKKNQKILIINKASVSILLILFSIFSFSQTNEADIIMKSKFGSINDEINDLLYFEKTDIFNTTFSGKGIKDKNWILISKEIWNGTIVKIDTLVSTSLNNRFSTIKDSLQFKIIAKKKEKETLKILFIFPKLRFAREFKSVKSDEYSLRAVGRKLNIKLNESFPAFAYILPYEKEGWKHYCAVDGSGKNVDDWGKEFGIEHYLVFEMKFF